MKIVKSYPQTKIYRISLKQDNFKQFSSKLKRLTILKEKKQISQLDKRGS